LARPGGIEKSGRLAAEGAEGAEVRGFRGAVSFTALEQNSASSASSAAALSRACGPKLRDCGAPLANFFGSGVLALSEKLGPILWQLPPQLAFDRQRLEDFFGILPRTTAQASRLAENRDRRLRHPAFLSIRDDRPIRHAVEVRHETFRDPAFVALLRKHDVAFCIADTAGRWPYFEDVTSNFVYVRLHGAKELYVSGYSGAALDRWAARIAAWRDGTAPAAPTLVAEPERRRLRDVFVYFDNDVKVRAPFDAIALARRLGIQRLALPT
jgi:uncharacterized protein YecE (DUF72 family)